MRDEYGDALVTGSYYACERYDSESVCMACLVCCTSIQLSQLCISICICIYICVPLDTSPSHDTIPLWWNYGGLGRFDAHWGLNSSMNVSMSLHSALFVHAVCAHRVQTMT